MKRLLDIAALATVPLGVLALTFSLLVSTPSTSGGTTGDSIIQLPIDLVGLDPDDVKPLPDYLHRSLDWLAEAQFENGGWGAGQHTRQGIDDPHAVQIDPATTAFAALALLRSGSTPDSGPYADNVSRALNYLVDLVEEAPENGPRITSIEGTQPQVKLGRNVDASMVSQFFSAILPELDGRIKRRTEAALDKCLLKIQRGQAADGSFSDGGWAGVLQSAMANNALEAGQRIGREIDEDVLERSRDYQESNVQFRPGSSGAAMDASAGAGVALYAASSSQRATAAQAREAEATVGEDSPVTVEALQTAGKTREEAEELYDAYRRNQATNDMLEDDAIWTGFGNNGGEEFLSYMMTSESKVMSGGEAWDRWHARLVNLFGSIQNQNGSWSGHHCITSPVFCTAAVILALTADRDRSLRTHNHHHHH
ncbi:MAG: hypothetical protein R3284_06880 [Rubricoccaceae bacterium]|nr:hypothetical protein [Rubricoccaceae bacterium]